MAARRISSRQHGAVDPAIGPGRINLDIAPADPGYRADVAVSMDPGQAFAEIIIRAGGDQAVHGTFLPQRQGQRPGIDAADGRDIVAFSSSVL